MLVVQNGFGITILVLNALPIGTSKEEFAHKYLHTARLMIQQQELAFLVIQAIHC